jgi:hypothetical protein
MEAPMSDSQDNVLMVPRTVRKLDPRDASHPERAVSNESGVRILPAEKLAEYLSPKPKPSPKKTAKSSSRSRTKKTSR